MGLRAKSVGPQLKNVPDTAGAKSDNPRFCACNAFKFLNEYVYTFIHIYPHLYTFIYTLIR